MRSSYDVECAAVCHQRLSDGISCKHVPHRAEFLPFSRTRGLRHMISVKSSCLEACAFTPLLPFKLIIKFVSIFQSTPNHRAIAQLPKASTQSRKADSRHGGHQIILSFALPLLSSQQHPSIRGQLACAAESPALELSHRFSSLDSDLRAIQHPSTKSLLDFGEGIPGPGPPPQESMRGAA